MTAAGDRLVQIAGQSGPAGALLLTIGSGSTAGAILASYSGIGYATAGEHLLAERSERRVFGGYARPARAWRRLRPRRERDEEIVWLTPV